jgi:hypothetical protein
MASGKVTLVHLVWAPAGAECLREFLESIARYEAGAEYELVLVYNGFDSVEEHAPFDAVAASVPHKKIALDHTVLDLMAYREVVQNHPSDFYFFANTYTRALMDGWLELLLKHQRQPAVGMVSTTGSWESMSSNSPLITRPLRLMQFKPFPNPHLRTAAFIVRADVLARIDWPEIQTKLDAWKFENGRHGLSGQVLDLGLKLIVAGADGVGYEWKDWPRSHTFRSGEQENLVFADNRTEGWRDADPAERSGLAHLAWRGAAQ